MRRVNETSQEEMFSEEVCAFENGLDAAHAYPLYSGISFPLLSVHLAMFNAVPP
jgi:hypothetical protein